MDDRSIYLKQLELGPMQNFVYLVGDPVTRQCVVVDPAWKDEWIGEYDAPTTKPLTTDRNPAPGS